MEQQLLEAASEAGRYARTDPESFIGATTHPAIVTPSSDEIQCVIVEIQETANELDRKQHELRELSQAV